MRHPTYDVVLNLIRQIPPKKQGLMILDAGCGNGLLLGMFPRKLVRRYIGMDISKDAITQAKGTFKGRKDISFKLESCTKLSLPSRSVDLVVSVGMLQYLTEAERRKFLREARRVLRPGGHLILTCLSDHLIYRVMDLYGLFSPHGCVKREELMKDLSRNGFKVDFTREYGLLISPFNSSFPCFFADAFDHLLGVRGRLGPAGQWLRQVLGPLERWEYRLPINFGYTLVLKVTAFGIPGRVSRDKS